MKIGIYGYGNLGKGVECACKNSKDMELVVIFTRRNPSSLKPLTPNVVVASVDDAMNYQDKIDVLILCGGSATDLPNQTPLLASKFDVVDSFDTHANIPAHFDNVDKQAKLGNKIAVISCGWDPGLFSIARVYSEAILGTGSTYTFWGRGVSQGHSDAIRRIDGVIDARQYTVPIDTSLELVREGQEPELTTRQKHLRECYVVAEDGADLKRIEKEIVEMPNYFADYNTTVKFISEEEMKTNHSTLPHGGLVMHSGHTGWNEENTHLIEFKLKLDSNPEFTGAVLVAVARAISKMKSRGEVGAKTILDIPPAFFSDMSSEELRSKLL